ncbi:hypothetical protein KCU85_g1392, partial [Aureobasidium melanogenum]
MPPRSNEILDSEDEDDLVAVKPPPLVATTPSGEDAPVDMDVDQSTASTEELLRRAQVALMAPTQEDVPVVNFSDLAATSVDTSPSSTNKKRPLLDTDPQPRSSGKLKRIKIVTKPESEDTSADVYDVPHIPPFDGTNDTIPGPTLPSAAGHDLLNPTRTPKPRLRNSSQNQHSSSDQMNSLTPWSGTAIASSDKISSDDAIGLPKEMYIPRPSRSRSAQVDNSHIDYAQNVEKATKKSRPKRSITDSADHSTSASIFPEHPIDQAPEFERLSPTPDAGHLKNSPQLASTVPESVQAPFSSAKSSKSAKKSTNTKQPGKRGRPRKNVIVDEEDELVEENVTSSTTKTPASAKTEVQVVIDAKPDSSLAATVYAQLQQRSRESTTKPLDERPPQEDISAPSQEASAEVFKTELDPEADEESEDEIVKPRTDARIKAKAKSKAKSKTPEPVYKEDDESEHEVYDEYSQEVIKTKSKSKAKPKAKAKARGKAAKAVVEPDLPSDHDEDTPEQPLVDDHESEADHISEAEEASEAEEESPKPRFKAKTKAKPEPKSKATAKSKPVAPEPAAATPKPSPPISQAETPKPAAVEVATPAAVVTPKVATIKKDAKSSTKPSWQQSTYRVGLSKTQRIPSLLKVFKK